LVQTDFYQCAASLGLDGSSSVTINVIGNYSTYTSYTIKSADLFHTS